MKILMVHNRYQQAGGEDQVFQAEKKLLEQYGHAVNLYLESNENIKNMNKFSLLKNTLWSRYSYGAIKDAVNYYKPDVVHFHNTFPLISPAAYYAVKEASKPVVQTLHNYRIICPNALLFRANEICEQCIKKTIPYPGVYYKCYRGDRASSTVLVAMLTLHNLKGTWENKVDKYIALTDFSKSRFVKGGIPENKIVVKPNFVERKEISHVEKTSLKCKSVVFVGRLTAEKGIKTLLKAWKDLDSSFSLKILGDGPLASMVKEYVKEKSNVHWLGYSNKETVYKEMAAADLLVFPSEWYEGFPMTLVEAMSVGLPVVATNVGSMSSIIKNKHNGLLFESGNAIDLKNKICTFFYEYRDTGVLKKNALSEFEKKYTPEINYEKIIEIYNDVLRY